MIRRQNSFSRVSGNDLRMGAFYTDIAHCKSIGEMFIFSDEEETCVIDPAIGDGTAVIAVTGADQSKTVKIFGIELNDAVAGKTKEDPCITECLSADFLEGTRLQRQAFTFCFCNPPYQTDHLTEDGQVERVEKQFLSRVTDILDKDALLVWVVPYHVMVELSHFRYFVQHYDILTCYKFRPEEYVKFHQVVLVARKKKDTSFLLREEIENLLSQFMEENLIELPLHPTERFVVPPSSQDKIHTFTERVFNAQKALSRLSDMENESFFDDLNEVISERITTKPFTKGVAGRPPIPPKKDTLYIMATSGYGAGITGSEETKDKHLQRGVAEVVEDSVIETDPNNPDKMVERVTSRTQITMTVVENNGVITTLQ